MNILITGGLGFIGFNFIQYLVEHKIKSLNYKLFCVDCCTYAAEPYLEYKLQYLKNNNIPLFKIDICDFKTIEQIITEYHIDGIINFAAETHVDNSIKQPDIFIKTNIQGTWNLLELSKKYDLRFHQISTDEVYGSVDPVKDIVNEEFKYNTSSPYSSSKASADLITLSYYKTFGTKVTISRCTNNYGKYQHQEKLIPKVIDNILHNKKIPVYGEGLQMRNWIHVIDHCDGIWRIFNSNKYGEIYNIGSSTLITNIELVKNIIKQLNASENLIEFVTDRPGHDFCYHLDSTKIITNLGWNQKIDFKTGLSELINFSKK